MDFLSRLNKHLLVRPGVVLTDVIDPVIVALDPYFEEHPSFVTSGLRDKQQQLNIIKKYAQLKGVAKEFPSILTATLDGKVMFEGKSVYSWQPGWSKLLNIGVIVNPPKSAMVLMDYIRDGVNLKGVTIGPSPHMKGTAFDVGGGLNGPQDEYEILLWAKEDIAAIRAVLLERENGACHVDCIPPGANLAPTPTAIQSPTGR